MKHCTIVSEKPRPHSSHWWIFVINCYLLLFQWPTHFPWRTHLSFLFLVFTVLNLLFYRPHHLIGGGPLVVAFCKTARRSEVVGSRRWFCYEAGQDKTFLIVYCALYSLTWFYGCSFLYIFQKWQHREWHISIMTAWGVALVRSGSLN